MSRIVPGSGAVLTPVFNGNYGIDYFIVKNGGSGYDPNDPPKIELVGSASSLGSFYPIISNGSIVSVRVVDPGYGYGSTYGDFESESDVIDVTRRLPGNSIVGINSFKLTSGGVPLFHREFDSSNGITTSIDLSSNSFILNNHNLQTGQKIFYNYGDGVPIGIGTTSSVESSVDIIIEVGGAGGGTIFENGYNVAISTSISGVSSNATPGTSNKYFGFGNPIPSYTITGVGTGAKFEVFITYDGSGSPLSTSIILKQGGGNYAIGDQVGIAGTFLDGLTPANNLTFAISKLSSSRISGQANQTYTNISGLTTSGTGSGAIFTVSRNSLGDISLVSVQNGGSGYALTSSIRIKGSDIGGNDVTDNAFVSPTVLGTNVLPKNLYVERINDNVFRVQGTPSSDDLVLSTLGIGSHSFTYDNPNASALILVDNIIQSPLYIRNTLVELDQPIGIGSTNIYLKVGISSISGLDFLKIDEEYLKIENIGIGSTNSVEVSRGYFGSISTSHSVGAAVTVVRGDYNIIEDSIYFSTPPYGEIGLVGLKVNSNFQGKAFSRSFDYLNNPNDKNIILDDISVDFVGESLNLGIRTGTLNSTYRNNITGIDTTGLDIGDVVNLEFIDTFSIKTNTKVESIGIGSIAILPAHNILVGSLTTTFSLSRLNFTLKSNRQDVVGLYTDTNGSGVDIDNNPFIIINNIIQIPEKQYTIDTLWNNKLKLIGGVPNAGRIVKLGLSTSFGYQPLVGAAATLSISGFGTISQIHITNYGSGYRVPPIISIGGTIGYGASFSANLGAGGTITSINIISPGIGYTYANEYFHKTGTSETISAGSSIIYVNDTSYVSIGASASIVGAGITNARIVSFGNTFINISSASTINSAISSGLEVIYTTFELPKLNIPVPPQYSNIPLSYLPGTTGSGKGAKISITVGNASSITSFTLENPGYGYKYGEKLVAAGIVTNPSIGANFNPLTLTVLEELTDKFSGFYAGQFIQIDDISPFFNGKRRKFTLTRTEFGEKTVLDLKSIPGANFNLQNNIFIYINDILQEPGESYLYNGTQVIFTEAPKVNSTCSIFYYRGSSLDVEEINPPETIKVGDFIQIVESKDNEFDITQFQRTVKKIVSSDEFDTFVYDSIGINTTTNLPRPLTWEKQTKDLIINGVLYSKERSGLKSRNVPTTRIIKKVQKNDNEIYVENAFPLFIADDFRGLTKSRREVVLVDKKEIKFPEFKSNVSTSSSISSIEVLDGGTGYSFGNSPIISISSSYIKKRDPILNWQSASGVGTNTINLTSINYDNYFISIGSSGKYVRSQDGTNWELGDTGFNKTFNDIISFSNTFIGVGSDATIIKGVGIGTTIPTWTKYELVKKTNKFGFIEVALSDYNSTFNKVSYMPSIQSIVAVGDFSSNIGYAPIFSAIGIGSTQFVEKATTNITKLNSITNNNSYFVVVGNSGLIRYSENADVWIIVGNFDKPQGLGNLNDVIWDGNRFIAVGNNGEIIIANSPSFWTRVNNNLSINIKTIKYYDGFYVVLSSSGQLYYSFNLSNWTFRSTLQANQLNDLIFIPTIGAYGKYVAIGSSATIIYSTPIFNRSTASSSVSYGGTIEGITMINGGFGYDSNSNPPVMASSQAYNKETLKSVDVKGDFGTIINVEPVGTAVTQIKFTLKPEYYDNNTYSTILNMPGIGYSSLNTYVNEIGDLILTTQLSKGDYFTIRDSNVLSNYPLTGITTYNGFVEKVGIITHSNVPISLIKGSITNNVISGINTSNLNVGDMVSTYEINYFPANTTITSIGSSLAIVSNLIQYTGILTSYVLFERSLITLDGVYSVEDITDPDVITGISTITCRFGQLPVDITNSIIKGNQINFYGRYSWGKIYNFQNRSRGNPKQFESYNDNGIIGISTSAEVYRTRPLI